MSEQTSEAAQITQWGVESPDGGMWTYHDPEIARVVSREQSKPVHRRTVTTTSWEIDPDNVGFPISTPPGDQS